MRHRNRLLSCVMLLGFAAALAGCPNPSPATRDGGIACTSMSACNPPGQICGAIHLCVQGFCAENTIVQACPDGAYPDSGTVTGDCLSYEECNGGLTCGSLIGCIAFHCDRTGPRLEIPCTDAGATDTGTQTDTGRGDTGVDAGGFDAPTADEGTPDAGDAGPGDVIVLVDTPASG